MRQPSQEFPPACTRARSEWKPFFQGVTVKSMKRTRPIHAQLRTLWMAERALAAHAEVPDPTPKTPPAPTPSPGVPEPAPEPPLPTPERPPLTDPEPPPAPIGDPSGTPPVPQALI
ncbi:hypothetical protein [Dyella monticola]|nr:hypothetical protein [Dyella monticola]